MSLLLAGRPAAFAELTAIGAVDLDEAADAAQRALLGRFPELEGLDAAAFREHPKRARYLLEYDLFVTRIPALRACWAGEGEPPAIDEIANARQADVVACCREVRRLNPEMTALPAPTPAEGEGGGDGPNPPAA